MEAKALITRKIGMTNTINEDGTVLAVTLLSASPNVITQVKTDEKDGYTALQVGFESKKSPSKPLAGHLKGSKATPAIIREFRVDELSEEMKVGENINADSFNVGDVVEVVGTSKGNTRKVGSIGSMYPQKIFKGKKMSGQMGSERVTVKNLKVALIDTERNIIGVTGAVPGPRKGIVLVKGVK